MAIKAFWAKSNKEQEHDGKKQKIMKTRIIITVNASDYLYEKNAFINVVYKDT